MGPSFDFYQLRPFQNENFSYKKEFDPEGSELFPQFVVL